MNERFGISKDIELNVINQLRVILLSLRNESSWDGKVNFNEVWQTLNYAMQHMDSLSDPKLSNRMFVFHMDCVLHALKKISVKPSLKKGLDDHILVLNNLIDLMCGALLIEDLQFVNEKRKIVNEAVVRF